MSAKMQSVALLWAQRKHSGAYKSIVAQEFERALTDLSAEVMQNEAEVRNPHQHLCVYCLLSMVFCLLSNVYGLLSTIHCLLSTVHCLASTVHCPLSTVYCFAPSWALQSSCYAPSMYGVKGMALRIKFRFNDH